MIVMNESGNCLDLRISKNTHGVCDSFVKIALPASSAQFFFALYPHVAGAPQNDGYPTAARLSQNINKLLIKN